MGRAPCCDKEGIKRGPWTLEEDHKLVDYIQKHGYGNWRTLPKNAGLQRCGKSCRLRWTNYLRPDIKRGKFSLEEEEMIIQLHSILGNKWSAIAARLPGRTDNEIKNYWNTRIRKRLLRMGIDPVTHAPRLDLLDLSSILNAPLYGSPQMRHGLSGLFGVQAGLVSPEILRLATSIVSPQLNPQCFPDRNFQRHQYHQQPIQDQLQTPVQEVPTCAPVSNEEASSQIMAHNVEGYCDPLMGYNNGFYYAPEHNYDTLNPTHNSVLSAATSSSSTPGNSNSPCFISGGGPEDERESYCTSLLNYEIIPDLLDINSCNEIEQLLGNSELLGPWNTQLS